MKPANVTQTPCCYSNSAKRNPGTALSFSPRPDVTHTVPQFSIHPYRNADTGRRQVYNTSKKPRS